MSSFSLSLFKRYVSSSSSPFATPPNLSSMEQSFQLRRVDYIIFSKKEIVYLYLFFLSLFLFQSKPSARSCRSLGWAEWGQEVGGGDVCLCGGERLNGEDPRVAEACAGGVQLRAEIGRPPRITVHTEHWRNDEFTIQIADKSAFHYFYIASRYMPLPMTHFKKCVVVAECSNWSTSCWIPMPMKRNSTRRWCDAIY
jgi:hypothetical protein